MVDRDSATWCSDFIGHRQVREKEEGYTYGYNNARDAVSLTSRVHIEPLLLPDQLMNLPRLSGYLKFPDGFPAAPIKLIPVNRKKRAEPFIRRAEDHGPETGTVSPQSPPSGPQPGSPSGSSKAPPDASGGGSDAADPPAANDDGAGQRIVPRQGELALAAGQRAPSGESDARPRDPEVEVLRDARRAEAEPPRVAELNLGNSESEAPTGAKPALALPKDSVLRIASGDGQDKGKDGEPPKVAPQRQVAKPDAKQRLQVPADQARKLMLEDGLSEPNAHIDRAQLLLVSDCGEAIEFEQVGKPHQLVLVGIADHRGFVEQHHGAAHFRPGLGERSLVATFQECGMALQEPGHGHRGNAGFTLEHLYQRVLDREPEHLPAFLAQDVGDRPQHRAFARTGNPLNSHDSVAGAKQKPSGSRERNLSNQQTFLVTITRLRDGLTLYVNNASRLEAAVERNTGMKRSALETVGLLRDAAAAGQTKGQVQAPAPEKQSPEKDRSIVRPFEIGI